MGNLVTAVIILSAELFYQELRFLNRYIQFTLCKHYLLTHRVSEILKLHPQKNLWVAYPMDLKLCLNSRIVCLLDVNGFWRENDATVIKANFHFPVIAQKVHDFERTRHVKRNAKTLLKKLQSVVTM